MCKKEPKLDHVETHKFTPIYMFGSASPRIYSTKLGAAHSHVIKNEYYTKESLWGDLKKLWKKIFSKKQKETPFVVTASEYPPYSSDYTTFSGVDITAQLEYEDDPANTPPVKLSTLQAINFSTYEDKVNVSLIFVLFQESNLRLFMGKTGTFKITLKANNEYGKMSEMSVGGLKFANYGSGISIDDIVSEEHIALTGELEKFEPWKEIKIKDLEDGVIETEMIDVRYTEDNKETK